MNVRAWAERSGAYWLTHQTNETAMTLYDKVADLADRSGFTQYRKIF
jgi:hypothetical protein